MKNSLTPPVDASGGNAPGLDSTPSRALRSALHTAALGLRVHPLRGKRPLLANWPTRAMSDAAQIREWLSTALSYGVVCDEIAVIDTDTADLSDWWRRSMPKTPWMVRTPRGGMHFVYRSIPGLRNAVKVQGKWDVRAGGNGYVVGFGSVVDGKQYELLGVATLDLPLFDPAWLPRAGVGPFPTQVAPAPLSGGMYDVRAYIRSIPSIQGQRGSDACFRVACILREHGYSPEEALQEMVAWNRGCADPAWSLRELEKKVRDAFAKAVGGAQ
ncbi:MAG: bifunctional DNA primase/polymerase [Planctomycetes bacterium]|nr:bifunctional DNA primase/polymerase [Planctomycetota bacterium]